MPDIDAGIEGIFLIIVGPRKFLALGRRRRCPCILGCKDAARDSDIAYRFSPWNFRIRRLLVRADFYVRSPNLWANLSFYFKVTFMTNVYRCNLLLNLYHSTYFLAFRSYYDYSTVNLTYVYVFSTCVRRILMPWLSLKTLNIQLFIWAYEKTKTENKVILSNYI